jgi:DNA-binding NarL/FixJ family response regulator
LPNIRVIIVDDHAILRDGIRTLLERQANIEVIGEASNGEEAISLVGELHPDIVLMDIAMPKLNGLDATRKITNRYSNVRVLILTQHDNREFITPILQAGASGYILKKSGGRELISAIREVYEQGAFLEPTITRQLLDSYAQSDKKDSDTEIHLTQREKEVLQLLIAGKSNKEIAFSLSISPKTVSVHRSNIMKKLEVHNIFELLRAVSINHLIDNTPTYDFLDSSIPN